MARIKNATVLASVKANNLPRVNDATTAAELLATVAERINALYWVNEADIIGRKRLSGIIPQGGATATVLRGKDETGKAHVSLRTQVAFGSKAEGAKFLTTLATMVATASVEDLKQAYYDFVDEVNVPLVVWEESEPEAYKAARSGRGTFSATLRVQTSGEAEGEISLSGAEAETDTEVTVIPSRTKASGTVMPEPTATAPKKLFNGTPLTEAEIKAQLTAMGVAAELADTMVAALPVA